MGDFNYPGIQWSSHPILVSNSHEQLFVDTIHYEALSQLVSQPTQFCIGSEPHLLDLLLTNEVNMVENIEYCSSLGKSDHVCVKFLVNCVFQLTKMILNLSLTILTKLITTKQGM